MDQTPATPRRPGSGLSWVWGALGGGAIGFAVASMIYLAITPLLEASTGLVRELQGLSWNLVPALTVIGAVLGGILIRARRRRR